MENGRVQSHKGITLVGAGHPSVEIIDEALKIAPTLVAADGGADFAIAAGFTPTAVIGDLDSLSDEASEVIDPACVLEIAEQDTTDFEKCLARIDAPFVLAVGFASGRLDHTLAAMAVLARQVGPPTILIGDDDLAFAARGQEKLDLAPDTRVSLFPMAWVTGRSEGLDWPINGIDFNPSGAIGTSNRASGPVTLDFDAPGMIVILPLTILDRVLPRFVG